MFRSNRSSTKRARSASAETDRPAVDAPRSGRITSLKPQQHDRERISVFLDGVFAFGLHQDLVLDAQLTSGMELDEATSASLLSRDVVRQATSAALNLLAYRPRAEGEIRTRLRQRGFPDEAIAEAVQKLRDWHYVDDQDFAERWVANRLERRPRSARVLAMELRGKGVDATTVTDTVDRAEIDELGDALRIATERWDRLSALDGDVRRRRITGFLSRRGYSFDIIRHVLKDLEATSEEGETD